MRVPFAVTDRRVVSVTDRRVVSVTDRRPSLSSNPGRPISVKIS